MAETSPSVSVYTKYKWTRQSEDKKKLNNYMQPLRDAF